MSTTIRSSSGLFRAALEASAFAALLGSASASIAEDKALLWVQPMPDHPAHRLMQAGFLAKCNELGYICQVVGHPASYTFASTPLAEAALARTKFGAVALYGETSEAFRYVGELGSRGIPVVTWPLLPPEGSVAGLKAATGENITAAGANAAVAMGEKLGGKGTVALTQSSFIDTENEMSAAFRAAIAAQYPDIMVLDTQFEGHDGFTAEAKAVDILEANPDVTGAFSTAPATSSYWTTGGSGARANGLQAWSSAASKADREVVIIGMDYIRQNLDIIKSGGAYGLVAQPLYEEGAKTAELAAALADGKTVPYLNPLPATVITAEDLVHYYAILDEAGQ